MFDRRPPPFKTSSARPRKPFGFPNRKLRTEKIVNIFNYGLPPQLGVVIGRSEKFGGEAFRILCRYDHTIGEIKRCIAVDRSMAQKDIKLCWEGPTERRYFDQDNYRLVECDFYNGMFIATD